MARIMNLEELEQDALKRHIPVMQKEGILFLIAQLNEIHATTCLEIGAAIGYSAMMMVTHVEGLKVDSIEIDNERYQEALENIEKRELSSQINLYHEDALILDTDLLKNQPYDCLFIDAAKAQYQKFFEKYVPFVKEKGIIIVDNLDFHGMIFDIDHIKNRNTKQLVKKIKRFKDWIFNHEDFDVNYYAVGDGICVIKRKENK
ncbi:O-methyltransferase [Candidatus Stoquefichus sp. SB1]|uniref:O-methyltransferase n=1 Tax=Candidatus Stoquefichus sp. SB1 TaxID=1658109 RepID=UPI00067F09D3|nr:O-methyltransferase [Candidatus Stoquefichus sp. SB1]